MATIPGFAVWATPSIVIFKFARDHFVNFFLRMEMFVNGCALHKVVALRSGS